KMSSLPGNLLYQGRGYKLKNGYADLPAVIKTFVENNFPEYAHAPATYTTPNMTSWRYFKKVMEQRKRR
ncbi:MAG: DUF1838 family protein, partial [Bacteroidota bacterium]